MVDAVQVIVKHLTEHGPSTAAALAELCPLADFDLRDHINGATELPPGYRVDTNGPWIGLSTRGGPQHYSGKLYDVSFVIRVWAADDEGAMRVACAIPSDLHERGGVGFTWSMQDQYPQMLPDLTTSARMAVCYYTINVRNP
jgi:hypothetical protein